MIWRQAAVSSRCSKLHVARRHSKLGDGIFGCRAARPVWYTTRSQPCTSMLSLLSDWLYIDIGVAAETVVAVFGATAITAPVCGVLTCATVVDRFIGGYQNYPEQTTWFALLMATAAVGSAIACCLVTDFWHLSYLIWLLLFFGGSIVPAATGIFQEPADKVAAVC